MNLVPQDKLKVFHDDFSRVLAKRNISDKQHAAYFARILHNPKINSREGIERFVEWVESNPCHLGEDPFPLYHYFGNGIYTREIHLPKGYAIVGKIHRKGGMIQVLKGRILVADENATRLIKAPAQFECTGGIRRIAYVLEDTIWINIHTTDKTTVEEAEEELFAYTYEELDYKNVIEELGFTHKEVRRLTEKTDDQIEIELKSTEVRESDIDGNGVFAIRSISQGEVIDIGRIGTNRTQLGRYTNHSSNSNCVAVIDNNNILFIATKDINKNQEVLVDYKQAMNESNKLGEKQCLQ